MIAGAAATGPRMQAGGGRTVEFTLLVRAYCHLCDEMRAALAPLAAARNATIRLIDVDAEPALEAAWGDLVPVLFIGEPAPGAELCHYHLDRARVEAALGEYAAEVPSQPKMR